MNKKKMLKKTLIICQSIIICKDLLACLEDTNHKIDDEKRL